MKKILAVLFGLLLTVGCQNFKGSQGPAGPQGATGATGPQGAPGTNGNCTVSSVPAGVIAPNGGSLIACEDGTQSLVLNGTNGTNGQPGTPGTLVVPVQFCPGVTPTYPSTFPEVGFCIDNNLYAVYSTNDGFLTEITPGAYNSNAVGSNCNFTVLPNCQIE